MKVNVASLGYLARKQLNQAGLEVRLGHAHQFVAAGFGYGTLASFQLSNDLERLGETAFFLVDTSLLAMRFEELEGGDGQSAADLIAQALMSCVHFTTFPSGPEEMRRSLQFYVNNSVLRESRVAALLDAPTSVAQVSLRLGELDERNLTCGIDLPVEGYVTAGATARNQARVKVKARVQVDQVGKKLFSPPRLQMLNAERV